MKKILVPTDFSDGAYNALIHAIHHAKASSASIAIVHAFLMPPTGTAVMVDITELLQKNAEDSLAQLRSRVEKLEIAKGLDITYHAKHGTVNDVLERSTTKMGIDLVIMGTQGASGITEKFLGSNAAAAARNLKTPVIAIPAEKPYKPIDKIVIATDLKKINHPQVFDLVNTLAQQHEAIVRFLHVRQLGEQFDQSESAAYKQQVASSFSGNQPVFTFIFENDIEEGLSDALEKEGADLLVVVRKERGFFQSLFHSSVSQQLVNEAALPVLVLKD